MLDIANKRKKEEVAENITEVENFLRFCKINKRMMLSTTIKQYEHDIYRFCWVAGIKNTEDLRNLKVEQIDKYFELLYDKGVSAATYNKRLSTLKSFYNYLELEEIINKNIFRKYSLQKIKMKPKMYLTLEDGYKLEHYAKNDRDDLIIKLYLSTGMRVSEMIALKIDNLKWATNEILIRRKGGKQQLLVIPMKIMSDIKYYIEGYRKEQIIREHLENKENPYLFISFRGNQMNPHCINQILKNTAKRAGIENWEKMHNHTMRTSYATQLHRTGVSDKVIQEQMGHNSIATTLQSYVQIDNEQIRNEIQGKGFNFDVETKESDYTQKIREIAKDINSHKDNV